jgi:uncharacterized LabA/DUF88 family protein
MVERVAIFIDAGYLFAAGSESIAGSKRPRSAIKLDHVKALRILKDFAEDATGSKLLRIYWYDGTSSGPTTEQLAIAYSENAKLRLGFVNTHGQQKGVDSLIVTDMITLARNGAMTDAILLSGDEDVRVGVQQAQEHGVRVHLLGIACGQQNQSAFLRQEADCGHLWHADDLLKFMSVDEKPKSAAPALPTPQASRAASQVSSVLTTKKQLEAAVNEVIGEMLPVEIKAIAEAASAFNIPRDADRKLLLAAKKIVGGLLSKPDCRQLRGMFVDACKAAAIANSHKPATPEPGEITSPAE